MGKAVSSVVKTVTNTVKNPSLSNIGKLGFATTGAAIGGVPGAVIGNEIGNKMVGGNGGGIGSASYDPNARVQQGAVDQRVAQSRQAAQDLIKQLQQQASGQGPSLAQAQLKAQTDKSIAQQLAAAAAARGGNPALAQRLQAQQMGAAQRDLAQQGSIARLQEQQNAMNALAGLTQSQQASDLNQLIQPASINAGLATAQLGADASANAAEKQRQSQLLGGLLSGGAALGAAALSDEREKKNIKGAKNSVHDFLEALSAHTYEYKDTAKSGTAPGKRVGVMAQDLEKSDMGKKLVMDTDQGKMVNTQQGFGAVLAAQAEMHKRLKALEEKKKA